MTKQQSKVASTKRNVSPDKPHAERYNVLLPYQFEHKGEKKTGWTDVGVAFPSRDGTGVNIELRPGLAVTGRLVLRPWQSKDAKGDDEGPRRFVYDPSSPADDLV
jgi:hypothetical protein